MELCFQNRTIALLFRVLAINNPLLQTELDTMLDKTRNLLTAYTHSRKIYNI